MLILRPSTCFCREAPALSQAQVTIPCGLSVASSAFLLYLGLHSLSSSILPMMAVPEW